MQQQDMEDKVSHLEEQLKVKEKDHNGVKGLLGPGPSELVEKKRRFRHQLAACQSDKKVTLKEGVLLKKKKAL